MIPSSVHEEEITTYQERLGSYLKKILQRIKGVLDVTWKNTTYQKRLGSYWRRCYDLSGTCWKLPEKNLTTYQ
jgi:hypothetical protein